MEAQMSICCPVCGGTMIGDGYTTVLHCENADESTYADHEPDARPVYCPPHDS
jgi:uncharacterized protein (DUF983 family)